MADHEDTNNVEEEIWEDLIELEEIPDGPQTIFVGGFSRYKTITEALEAVATSNDRIVVLTPQKATNAAGGADVTIDTTRLRGVTILGATVKNTLVPKRVLTAEEEEEEAAAAAAAAEEEEMNEDELDPEERARRAAENKIKKDTTIGNISVEGRLILRASGPADFPKLPTGFPEVEEGEEDSPHNNGGGGGSGDGDEDDDEGNGNSNNGGANNGDGDDDGSADGGRKKAKKKALAVTINGLNFSVGVTAEAQTMAYIEDCAFGVKQLQSQDDQNHNHHASSPSSPPSSSSSSPPLPDAICARINALSTVEFERCQLHGINKAVVYCYPHSRATFADCDVFGATRAPTAAEIAALTSKKPRGYVPPAPPAPAVPKPEDTVCAVGIYADDSSCHFSNVDVGNVGIGIFARGASKGFSVSDSAVARCNTVGVLFDDGCCGALKQTTVKLCGRECGVFGAGHPTVRSCTFVGDVRLKKKCVASGLTDNVVGLSGLVINEETQFHLKGFEQVAHDPTSPKKPRHAPVA